MVFPNYKSLLRFTPFLLLIYLFEKHSERLLLFKKSHLHKLRVFTYNLFKPHFYFATLKYPL